jgi:uncharacterized protein
MKYLILFAVIFVVWMLVRSSARRAEKSAAPPPAAPRQDTTPAVAQDMVRCPVCAVHLPRSDALPGPGGQLYCSREHQQSAGQ